MKKALAALGVSVGVFGGGVAGFLVTSNASSVGAVAPLATDAPPTTAGGNAPGAGATDPAGDRTAWIDTALAPLVKAGTITQDQADKVKAALQAAGPMGHRGGPGFGGIGRGGMGGAELDAVAKALNMTTADLQTAIKAGTSIADLAKKQNVELQTVIDAAVAPIKAKFDQAVTAGKLTQAQADTQLKNLTSRLTDFLNGKLPTGEGGWGGMGGFGPGGFGPGMGGHHRGGPGRPGGPAGPGDADAPNPAPAATRLPFRS